MTKASEAVITRISSDTQAIICALSAAFPWYTVLLLNGEYPMKVCFFFFRLR